LKHATKYIQQRWQQAKNETQIKHSSSDFNFYIL
jgi:hypothetical protein